MVIRWPTRAAVTADILKQRWLSPASSIAAPSSTGSDQGASLARPVPTRVPGVSTRIGQAISRTRSDSGYRLVLPDEIGRALRAHRRLLGLSRDEYAARRGWSTAWVVALETNAGQLTLVEVMAALESTPFRLYLGSAPSCPASQDAQQSSVLLPLRATA